jgi:hypothetical protein
LPVLKRQGKAYIGLPTINILIFRGLACWYNSAIDTLNLLGAGVCDYQPRLCLGYK